MTVPAEKPLSVNVVGLGYVGWEVCLAAVTAGHRVAGIDADPRRIRILQTPHAAADAQHEWADLQAMVTSDELRLYHDVAAAPAADVWVVAVPTPLDDHGQPDTSHISDAAAAIAKVVRPNAVVVLESTSHPGTTEEIFLPHFQEAGWAVGVDLFVGYSPERIDPGRRDWVMASIPKLVSGCTKACLKAVAGFYESIVEHVHRMSSTRAAEMAKLYENSWRLVNIAFANEIEAMCTALGLDPWEVAEACRTKPFGYYSFDPGPGIGGPCIPVDAAYLSAFARAHAQTTSILDSALAANQARPSLIVERVLRTLDNHGAADEVRRVLLIGMAYKSNVADVRESPALAILQQLEGRAVEADFHDPLVPTVQTRGGIRMSVPLDADHLAHYDCVVVLTAHDAVDWGILKDTDVPVIDTRNVLADVRTDW